MPWGMLPQIPPPGLSTEQQAAQTDFDTAMKAYKDFIAQNTGPGSAMAQATTDATQAGQQYQTAAAQPMPAFSPLDRLPVFFSQLGDIMGQTNTLAPAAERNLSQQSEDHVKARQENLAAMKDLWEKKIAASQNLPPQVELEARQKLEQINKAIQQIHDLRLERTAELHDDATVKAAGLRTAGTVDAASIAANQRAQTALMLAMAKFGVMPGQGGGSTTPPAAGATKQWWDGLPEPPDPVKQSGGTTMEGDRYIIMDNAKLPSQDLRLATAAYAGHNNVSLLNPLEGKALGEIQISKQIQVGQFNDLTSYLPPDWQTRPSAIAGITIGAFLQSKPAAAAYGAWRESALQQLKATSDVTGNRQAQQAMLLVQKNDIFQRTDNIPTALKRMQIVTLMTDARQNWLLHKTELANQQIAEAYRQLRETGVKLPKIGLTASLDKSGMTAEQKRALYDRLTK